MKKCWDEKFEKRPEFSLLVQNVGNMLMDSYKKVFNFFFSLITIHSSSPHLKQNSYISLHVFHQAAKTSLSTNFNWSIFLQVFQSDLEFIFIFCSVFLQTMTAHCGSKGLKMTTMKK